MPYILHLLNITSAKYYDCLPVWPRTLVKGKGLIKLLLSLLAPKMSPKSTLAKICLSSMTCCYLGGGQPVHNMLLSSCTLSRTCLATTTLYTKKASFFHVPSRHLGYDYGSQFKTFSDKHCSNSLAFIFSCLLTFRYEPITRWSTLY